MNWPLSRDAYTYKRAMDREDMREISEALGCEYDDTIMVLYQRGNYSSGVKEQKKVTTKQLSRIRNSSVFK